MSTGNRIAAQFANAAGLGLLLAGAGLHLSLVIIPIALIEIISAETGIPKGGATLSEVLFMGVFVLAGVLLVAIGGGMRYFSGLMSGRMVAGRLVRRILFCEWVRYEGSAAAFGLIAGGALALGGMMHFPGTVLLSSLGSVFLGVLCGRAARAATIRSEGLMWEIRMEGVSSGMVPLPAESLPIREFTVERAGEPQDE